MAHIPHMIDDAPWSGLCEEPQGTKNREIVIQAEELQYQAENSNINGPRPPRRVCGNVCDDQTRPPRIPTVRVVAANARNQVREWQAHLVDRLPSGAFSLSAQGGQWLGTRDTDTARLYARLSRNGIGIRAAPRSGSR